MCTRWMAGVSTIQDGRHKLPGGVVRGFALAGATSRFSVRLGLRVCRYQLLLSVFLEEGLPWNRVGGRRLRWWNYWW